MVLIEILKRAPSWVFVLFFALLALGYWQSKDRLVSLNRVIILPAVMLALSLYGVLSAFGANLFPVTTWMTGVGVAAWSGLSTNRPSGMSYMAESKSFFVPGSWVPLCFMMAIYFTKFTVGVVMARKLPIAGEQVFVGFVSLVYGLFSGVFFVRAIAILKAFATSKEKTTVTG
jgi:hypothetical protein